VGSWAGFGLVIKKPGGQLYVNRGIGTTGPPIRLGARPEITVLELTGNVTPACRTSKIGEIGSFLLVYRRVVVHWRSIILLLVLSLATFLIAQADFFDLLVFALFLICIASQFFLDGRILDLGERFIRVSPAAPGSRSSQASFIYSSSPTAFPALNRPVLTFSAPPTIGCAGF